MQQDLTLYIGLEDGTCASLSSVAKAALALEELVNEVSFLIDPSVRVRMELESGTVGSLKLNSILKTVGNRALKKETLYAILLTCAGWFADDVRSYLSERLFDSILAVESNELSEDEAQLIASKVAELLEEGVGKKEASKVYSALESDKNITSVGITGTKDTVPQSVVPRAQFLERMNNLIEDESVIERVKTTNETLTLISPVLIDSSRRWKFSSHEGEFGASIADLKFLNRVLSGSEPIPMSAGITLSVVLETRYQKTNGLWSPKERKVVEVLDVNSGPRQTSFGFSGSDE